MVQKSVMNQIIPQKIKAHSSETLLEKPLISSSIDYIDRYAYIMILWFSFSSKSTKPGGVHSLFFQVSYRKTCLVLSVLSIRQRNAKSVKKKWQHGIKFKTKDMSREKILDHVCLCVLKT